MSKKYQIIYADPPWEYKEGWPAWRGEGKRKPLPYSSMTLDEIKALPVNRFLKNEGYLFLWSTNRYLEQGFEVLRAWGCIPKQTLTWCKKPVGIGPGGMFANTTEFLIIGQKIRQGTNAHGARTKRERVNTSWFLEPKSHHSKKPSKFRELIERTCYGPYLELFAREKTEGWDVWGNEVESDIDLLTNQTLEK